MIVSGKIDNRYCEYFFITYNKVREPTQSGALFLLKRQQML
ncbi:hypothetical protein SSYM_1835 [Serratia symbiotica str. Tucson]|uniref:Uncharacterized protein n=1 Tax=Serratia symbiotica str. Tucson TaxID=914128 RepID=E9CMT7_9GAMM|nr:hypothetical protein SSYM_1835 [Serratia symbiotica str. Tucson]